MASPDTVGAWAVILLAQTASVVGDAFGQRTSRVVHGGMRRRMIVRAGGGVPDVLGEGCLAGVS